MSRLPSSGNSLSVSQINTLKSLGTVQTSLDTREAQYMGDPARTGTSNVATSNVCMPSEIVNETTGALAKNTTGWTYSGPQIAWRPVRVSEFYQAYNSIPTQTITKINTGVDPTVGQIRVDCSGSDAGGPYYIYYSALGIGGAWYAASDIGGGVWRYTFNVSSTNNPHVFRVRDAENCGSSLEISQSVNYP
jgi:hypothetical protein